MTKIKSTAVNGIITAVFAIALILFIITFSIGLPIYVRPFYYMQIEPLGIEEQTGRTKEEIIEGYDEVLDFLTLGKEFGTGVFKYSESGKSHFEDCKVLFDLNAYVLLISSAILILLAILAKCKVIRLCRPLGFGISFFSGAGTLLAFATVGALAATNFERAFTIFHKICFPGKDNWYFAPWLDEIILAMPSEFFMNCAILILVSIITLSAVAIIVGTVKKVRGKSLSL